jgi:hypothetical protein
MPISVTTTAIPRRSSATSGEIYVIMVPVGPLGKAASLSWGGGFSIPPPDMIFRDL